MKFKEYYNTKLISEGSEYDTLKKYKQPLTDEERKECKDKQAVWHMNGENNPTSAVWKSIDPKTGNATFVTNTHRAYNTAPTLKGAIERFHKFIKSTA